MGGQPWEAHLWRDRQTLHLTASASPADPYQMLVSRKIDGVTLVHPVFSSYLLGAVS